VDSGVNADCPFEDAKRLGIAFTPKNGCLVLAAFNRYLVQLYEYLQILENRLFSAGLHTLGEELPEQLASYPGLFWEEVPEEVISNRKWGVGSQH